MRIEVPKNAIFDGLLSGHPFFGQPANQQLVSSGEIESGDFDVQMNVYRQYIGWHKEAAICSLPPTCNPDRKIVIANDFHAPFQHEGALAELIRREAADTDLLVLGGDVADMWSFSRFSKLRRVSTPIHDFQQTQKVMNTLSENFRAIDIIEGNHCTRQWKYMAELLPVEVLEYLEVVAPAAIHPLEKICEELPNVNFVQPRQTGFAEFPFLHQVGDAIISHAEVYSKIPNRAVGNLIQWLQSFATPSGIVNPNWRVALQAHTHQAGKTHCDFGKVGFELGCMCHTQEYQGSPKIQSVRPIVRGWTVLYQDENGRTDINRSHFHQFEEPAEPIKDPEYHRAFLEKTYSKRLRQEEKLAAQGLQIQ